MPTRVIDQVCIVGECGHLGVTLGGLAMGYLLVTGYWRPSRLRDLLKMWQLRKRRRGLYVVPPKDKTLH